MCLAAEGQDKQKRVWNMLNKGDIFIPMIQHPFVMAVFEKILGDDFAMGSIASNTLLPGATGQEPHLDYPYWDFHNRKHWPLDPKACPWRPMRPQLTYAADAKHAILHELPGHHLSRRLHQAERRHGSAAGSVSHICH